MILKNKISLLKNNHPSLLQVLISPIISSCHQLCQPQHIQHVIFLSHLTGLALSQKLVCELIISNFCIDKIDCYHVIVIHVGKLHSHGNNSASDAWSGLLLQSILKIVHTQRSIGISKLSRIEEGRECV